MGLSARLDNVQLYEMAQSLSKLANPVLWPLSLSDSMTSEILNLNSNVMVVDWVPQNDVLGHPAVAAFVSHA